jgi:hypothetical protein
MLRCACMKTKNLLSLFIVGSSLGASLDLFHNLGGVSGYLHPSLWGLPWWVFPEFGVAVVLIALTHHLFQHKSRVSPNIIHIPGSLVLFASFYGLSAVLAAQPVLCLFILLIGFIGLWYWTDRSRKGLMIAVGVAIAGTSFEALLTQTGHFFYWEPHLWGVPFWLPLLYLSASTTIGTLSQTYISNNSSNRN